MTYNLHVMLRFDFEVQLLEQRVASGKLSPEEATGSVQKVREQVVGANAVGDLASLEARLDALAPVEAVRGMAVEVAQALDWTEPIAVLRGQPAAYDRKLVMPWLLWGGLVTGALVWGLMHTI